MENMPDGKLTIFQSELYMTNSVVVETEDIALIVDPCWLPREVSEIRRHVDTLPADKPRYLLFTHSDFDHIIGCKAFGDAAIIGSERLAEKGDEQKEQALEQIRKFDDDYYLVRDYSLEYPSVDIIASQEGQRLQVGNTALRFMRRRVIMTTESLLL